MGQKSLNFSVSKCIRAQYNSDICKDTYQTTPHSCKSSGSEWTASSSPPYPPSSPPPQRRYTTEELSRWSQRFSKAKIASRRQQDLRREVLLHNAFLRAQTEIKSRQEERQKRWKELKPLFRLETYVPHSGGRAAADDTKMAEMTDKMASDAFKMADTTNSYHHQQDMEVERPSTPLPSVGAVKRSRCGCSPMIRCLCGKDSIPLSNKKYRPSVADHDEDVDLKSLDQFLSSLHCNSRQVG